VGRGRFRKKKAAVDALAQPEGSAQRQAAEPTNLQPLGFELGRFRTALAELVSIQDSTLTNTQITQNLFLVLAQPAPDSSGELPLSEDARKKPPKVSFEGTTAEGVEVTDGELKAKKSNLKAISVGEPGRFLGIPVKIWVGGVGGFGLLALVAYIVYLVVAGPGAAPPEVAPPG
jgi:hypothetical protein